MKKKKSIIYAFIAACLSLCIFYVLFSLKYGNEWKDDGQSIYFIIAWSIGWAYVAYGTSKKIINKRIEIFGTSLSMGKNNEENNSKWQDEKKKVLIKALKTGKFLFGVSVPLFVLAYLDNSHYIKSNLYIIAFLLVATIVCWILEVKLKNKKNDSINIKPNTSQ